MTMSHNPITLCYALAMAAAEDPEKLGNGQTADLAVGLILGLRLARRYPEYSMGLLSASLEIYQGANPGAADRLEATNARWDAVIRANPITQEDHHEG